eukprot:1415793-Lingulodinium_polyedra.AAC.1
MPRIFSLCRQELDTVHWSVLCVERVHGTLDTVVEKLLQEECAPARCCAVSTLLERSWDLARKI